MHIGLHTGSILHTNLMTDIRVAKETGYDAIEFYIPKLVRYLDAGYQAEELRPVLGSLKLAMINSFLLSPDGLSHDIQYNWFPR